MVNKVFYWLILLGLLLLTITPLLVSTSLFFPFITGKGFFFRIVTEIILALWLILAFRDLAYRPKRSWILTAMGSLLLVLTLATAWGANPYRSFWSNFERMEGLISYLHLFVYFIILISVLKKEKLWQWFSQSLLVVNAIIAIYSLLQLTDKLTINQGGVRVDATFGNATYLAVYELFNIFLILFCLFRLWQSSLWKSRVWRRILGAGYILLGLLDLVILYNTATRGAILGLGFGLIVAAILIIWREKKEKMIRRSAWMTLVILVVIIVGFFAVKNSTWVAESSTLSRFASISVDDRTTQSRFLIWNMSWQGFKERPILGWGPENYILVFNKYYDPAMYNQEQWFDRSHNVIFDWLISAGALGLLTYLSLFGTALYLLWWKKNILTVTERSLFTGLLAAYFFHNLFVFDNLISYLLFLALLGYIHFRSIETSSLVIVAKISRSLLAPAVIIAIIFIPTLYLVNIKPILASQTLIEALSWQKYPDKALESFKKVFSYQTFASTEASEHLINAALGAVQDQSVPAEIRSSIVSLAKEQILETIKREPENARYRFFTGSFFLRVGLPDEAKKYLEEARQLSPHKQAILFELGSFYLSQKEFDEALVLFRGAYESAPNYDEARKLYILTLIYVGQVKEADKLLIEKFGTNIIDDERFINAYAEVKLYDRVLALWQIKVAKDPKNSQNHISLAAAYLAVGQRQKAIEELNLIIKLDPSFKANAERFISEIRAGRTP